MNQLAQAARVTAVRHCPPKRTFNAAAGRASPQTVGVTIRIGREQPLAANVTNFAAYRMDTGEAIGADG
jgi:hypothetical protein